MDGDCDANLRRKPPALQRATVGGGMFVGQAWLVAAVHSPETLRAAGALRSSPGAAPDLLELRVDHFADDPGSLDGLLAAPPRPLVITVRHSDEGGAASGLEDTARRRLYERFLPAATCVDVEVRSFDALAEVMKTAGDGGVQVVGSFHDFEGTPPVARLRGLAEMAIPRRGGRAQGGNPAPGSGRPRPAAGFFAGRNPTAAGGDGHGTAGAGVAAGAREGRQRAQLRPPGGRGAGTGAMAGGRAACAVGGTQRGLGSTVRGCGLREDRKPTAPLSITRNPQPAALHLFRPCGRTDVW